MKSDKSLKMPTSSLWYKQAYTNIDPVLKSIRGYVDLGDMCSAFIKPQTKGTGMSVALNMQKTRQCKSTEVMVSHNWSEDMHQVLNMLEEAKGTRLQNGKVFGDSTVIWFCALAQYQPNDGMGPSIEQQLELDPFSQVIQSQNVKDMFVIQTKASDPYSRMWCVIELGEALKRQKEGNFKIHPFFSREWLEEYIVPVEDLVPSWSSIKGEIVLRSKYVSDEETLIRGQGFKLDKAKNDIKKYYLMERDEKGKDPKTNGQEPKLKTNVREGLTKYGQFDNPRQADVDVFVTISKRFESSHNAMDGWRVLQRMIVDFQEKAAMKVYAAYIKKQRSF